jgi:hypothetical protein
MAKRIATMTPPIYVIKRVTRWASSDAGEMIQLEINTDRGPIILRCAYEDLPKFLQAAVQGGAIAEQKQKAAPGQGIDLVSPWMATNVRTGVSVDGKHVGATFQTTQGVPVDLTMPTKLAELTIERLSAELDKLRTNPPGKLS